MHFHGHVAVHRNSGTVGSENAAEDNMTNNVKRGHASCPRKRLTDKRQHRLVGIGAVMLITALALPGCSDPKEANATNFAKAISDHLAQHGEVCLEPMNWPVKVRVRTGANSLDFPQSEANRMAALDTAGLVAWTMDETKDIFNPSLRTKHYNLTDKGRQYLLERKIPNFLGEGFTKRTDLCWGRIRLTEVRKWIRPEQFGGSQVASVKFAYQIDGVPEWARMPAISQAFPAIPDLLEGQGIVERNANLHLTNLGWESTR